MIGNLIKSDFRSEKKTILKSCVYISLLFICISLLFCYSKIVEQGMCKADAVNASSNRLSVMVNKDNYSNDALMDEIKNIPGVYEVQRKAQSFVFGGNGRISVGEIERALIRETWAIECLDRFPKAYHAEAESKGLAPIITAGRFIQNASEAVCSEAFLDLLKIEDRQSVLGKRMLLEICDSNGEIRVVEKTFVGVVGESLSELDCYEGQFLPTVFLSSENGPEVTVRQTSFWYYAYLDSYFFREKISDQIKDVLPDGCYVAAASDSASMATLEWQRRVLLTVLSIICSIVCVGLVFGYIAELSKSIKDKRAHYKNLLASGLSEKSLFLLIVFEEMIKCVAALFVTLAVDALSIFVITKQISSAIRIPLSANYAALGAITGIAIGGGALLSITLAISTILGIRKNGSVS